MAKDKLQTYKTLQNINQYDLNLALTLAKLKIWRGGLSQVDGFGRENALRVGWEWYRRLIWPFLFLSLNSRLANIA